MQLKTIDAKTANSNVYFYKKQQELKEEEERIKNIQKVFDIIEQESKQGCYSVSIHETVFDSKNLETVVNMLVELGYDVTSVNGGKLYITWI